MAVIYMPPDPRQQLLGQALMQGIEGAAQKWDANRRMQEYERLTQLQQQGGYSPEDPEYLTAVNKTLMGNPETEKMIPLLLQERSMGLREQQLKAAQAHQQAQEKYWQSQADTNQQKANNQALHYTAQDKNQATANTLRAQGLASAEKDRAIAIGQRQQTIDLAQKRLALTAQNQQPITDSGAKDLATIILTGGQIPQGMSWGLSKGGSLSKVWKYVDQGMKQNNMTPQDIVAAKAKFRALQDNLSVLARRQGQIESSQPLVTKTVPLVQRELAAIPRSQYPTINSITNLFYNKSGDPRVAKLTTYLNTIVNAYARATSNTGAVTNEARATATAMLNKGMSTGQINAVLDAMMQEIENENVGNKENMDKLLQGFIRQSSGPTLPPVQGSGNAPTTPQSASPDASKVIGGKTYLKYGNQWFEQ